MIEAIDPRAKRIGRLPFSPRATELLLDDFVRRDELLGQRRAFDVEVQHVGRGDLIPGVIAMLVQVDQLRERRVPLLGGEIGFVEGPFRI